MPTGVYKRKRRVQNANLVGATPSGGFAVKRRGRPPAAARNAYSISGGFHAETIGFYMTRDRDTFELDITQRDRVEGISPARNIAPDDLPQQRMIIHDIVEARKLRDFLNNANLD